MKHEMLATIEAVLIEAGHVASSIQASATSDNKADGSIVTSGDLAVSALIQKHLEPWLKKPGHFWVDEERVAHIGSPAEVLDGRHEYIWVTDPIDGTAPYACGRESWGTIFGVLHRGAPFVGGFSLPLRDMLFMSDGDTAWLIRGAWSGKPQRQQLEPPTPQVAGHCFFEIDRREFGTYYDKLHQHLWGTIPESAVSGQSSALLGHSVGHNQKGYWSIWDIAGSAAVFKALDMPWRERSTGQVLERFEGKHFKPTWKLDPELLACRPYLYETLDNLLKKAEA